MDTWRCPTCLTVLMESTAKRCPACHSKLRKRRGQPIVLGEASRLDQQASLLVDRQNRLRFERGPWDAERPAPTPETFRRAEVEPAPAPVIEPVAFVEPEPAPLPEPEPVFVVPEPVFVVPEPEMFVEEPEPELELEVLFDESEPELEPYPFFEPIAEDAAEPAPEPAVSSFLDLALAGQGHSAVTEPAYADLDDPIFDEPVDAEPELEPVASPSFLDLALAEHVRKPAAPTISATELDAALEGDVNSVVDALHRKARGEQVEVKVEVPPVQLFEDAELPSRSLRLMAPASSNRRRWNIDFKSRRGDDV